MPDPKPKRTRKSGNNPKGFKINPESKDWRLPFVKDLADCCRQIGLIPSDSSFYAKVLQVFYEKVAIEEELPEAERLGYVKARDRYKDPRTMSHIVTQVRKHWPTVAGEIYVNIPNNFEEELAKTPTAQPKQVSEKGRIVQRYKYDDPFESCLSVILNGAYDAEGVRNTLETCLKSRFPECCVIIEEIKVLNPKHFDLLISHRGYVSEFCESLKNIDWISELFSKPMSEHGVPMASVVSSAA